LWIAKFPAKEATFKNALSRSARFGLSREDARKIIEQLIATVQKWRNHFEECGLTGKQIDALTPSFDRCNSVKW
jgi:serine/threonine-protein kinase HipA